MYRDMLSNDFVALAKQGISSSHSPSDIVVGFHLFVPTADYAQCISEKKNEKSETTFCVSVVEFSI